jgi:hypothetical protein
MFKISKESLRAFIGEREIKLIKYDEKVESEVEFPLNYLDGVKVNEYPDWLASNIIVANEFAVPAANQYLIYRASNAFTFEFTLGNENGYFRKDLATESIYQGILDKLSLAKYKEQFNIIFEDSCIIITFDLIDSDESLLSIISSSLILARNLIKEVESRLIGFQWKSEYEVDEPLFTKDLVIPLLRKMGFEHVRYNHGQYEYGKDVLFSELNKFGFPRYCVAQVKAGDISGGSGGLVDKLIAQSRDAFGMQVEGAGQARQYYISEFYIIASGKISENAVKKINNKIDKHLMESIHFLDRNDIENLAHKFWPLQ